MIPGGIGLTLTNDGLYLEDSNGGAWVSWWIGPLSGGLENLDHPDDWLHQDSDPEEIEYSVQKQELLLPKEYML